MTEALFLFIRAAMALGGALLGWILGGMLVRALYRAIRAKPTPSWLVPIGKLGGAVVVALLVFFFLPLGGGDGWGWGPGWGSGAGEGPHKGTSEHKETGDGKAEKKLETATRTQLEIELLGGANVVDSRYYLLKRRPPARSLAEVEAELKDQVDQLEVHLVFTDNSIATSHPAAGRLRDLLRQHRIPMVEVTGK